MKVAIDDLSARALRILAHTHTHTPATTTNTTTDNKINKKYSISEYIYDKNDIAKYHK